MSKANEQKFKRKRLWVDRSVQGTIVLRAVLYWGACLLFVSFPHAVVLSFTDPSKFFFQHVVDVWQQNWAFLVTVSTLLPFMIRDFLKLSNRFAGPIFRLRRDLKAYLDGEPYREIKFRDGDYWTDLADYCNQIVARAEQAKAEAALSRNAERDESKELVNA